MPEAAVHVIICRRGILRRGPSKVPSFLSAMSLLFFVCICWLLWVGRVTTKLFVLQNGGCKVNEMPLTTSVPQYPQPTDNDTVISSGFKMGHRHWCLPESQRFCTQWMYFCNGSSQKSHTSCQTRLCTMKEHYVVMYRLVPSGFLASDRKMAWKQRLWSLFDFLWLSLRMRPDLCGLYPVGMIAHMKIQWLHTDIDI